MELLHPPLRSALRLPFDPALKVYWDIPGLLGTMPCMSVVALVLAIGVLAWRVRNIPSEQGGDVELLRLSGSRVSLGRTGDEPRWLTNEGKLSPPNRGHISGGRVVGIRGLPAGGRVFWGYDPV
ncbi:hypothetical protein T484DRAFT_1656457 [Baffinella frigidus]|nr:hypothetical protein T484DRAFT_1656457 [Cryptophyta sp. CCMP2293]